MKNNAEGRNIFLFLTGNVEEGRYFCRSFFPQDKMDYTKNQASWTLGFSFVWITIGLSSTFLMFKLPHLRFWQKNST